MVVTTILTNIAISCQLMIMLTRVVTDNKDLGFATSQEELAEMCPKLMDGLRLVIIIVVIITNIIIDIIVFINL